MDNLESQTYEVFEKDPIKYSQYQQVNLSQGQAMGEGRSVGRSVAPRGMIGWSLSEEGWSTARLGFRKASEQWLQRKGFEENH